MQIGNTVVCIDDTAAPVLRKLYTQWPREGAIYTVRGVELGQNPFKTGIEGQGEVAILLEELRNPAGSVAPFRERAFNSERFRIIDEVGLESERLEEDLMLV